MSNQFCYCMHFMYDGTNYSGWQVQPNATSIQQIVKEAVHMIAREPVSVVGSGRTDAGVHALDQPAHFSCSHKLNITTFSRSLNGILPVDIRLTHMEAVPLTFHAQKSAIRKEYHYYLCLDPVMPPFHRLYSLHVRHALDLALLQKACSAFVGTHDFTSFANSAKEGAASKNAIRTIFRLDPKPWQYGIRLEFEGNGFLYKMVRNIVGMLLMVSSGKMALDDIDKLFIAKDRRQAPMGAAAKGLFLAKVTYE